MIGIKDYVDQMMEETIEINGDEGNIGDNFEMGVCPFCHSEELIVAIKKTPAGKDFNHFCVHCNKSWLVEVDNFSGEMKLSEIDLSALMPADIE
jgi:hypothetical protein